MVPRPCHPTHGSLHCDACATRCAAPGAAGMVFAKNSDRPPGEVQIAWPFGRRASAGCTLRTQYLSIGDTGAHATFLSCPDLALGGRARGQRVRRRHRERACQHDARRRGGASPALIGMDLVRLGLERARSAAEAVDVLTGLLETYGQGGIADAAHNEAYDSSFLVADPTQAFVLETAGSDYAVAPSPRDRHLQPDQLGTEWTSASAALAPGDDFDRFRDPREDTAFADVRLAASRRFLGRGRSRRAHPGRHRRPPARSRHGPLGRPGCRRRRCTRRRPRVGDGSGGVSVCMHVPRPERHRGVHDRRAPDRTSPTGRRCAPTWRRAARAPASTCRPSRARRPGRRRSSRSSSRARSCGTPPTPCASASRTTPTALPAVRAVLAAGRGRAVGRGRRGPRGPGALGRRGRGRGVAGPSRRCAPASPDRAGAGGTLRCNTQCNSYSPRGPS